MIGSIEYEQHRQARCPLAIRVSSTACRNALYSGCETYAADAGHCSGYCMLKCKEKGKLSGDVELPSAVDDWDGS